MPVPKLGVVLHDDLALRIAEADDPVDLVVLRSTLLNPPRAAAAAKLAARIRELHPDAEVVPYVWHMVSHAAGDGLRDMATRTLPGEARRYGHLQESAETAEAWNITKLCAESMGASSLVLRTPASFTPSAAHRERLRAFVAARAAESLHLVWEAEGLWEPRETQAIARDLDLDTIVPAFDGTGRPFKGSLERRWLRVDGAGPTTRLRPLLAEGLLAAIEDSSDEDDEPVVLFGGPYAYANLRFFASYVLGEGEPA